MPGRRYDENDISDLSAAAKISIVVWVALAMPLTFVGPAGLPVSVAGASMVYSYIRLNDPVLRRRIFAVLIFFALLALPGGLGGPFQEPNLLTAISFFSTVIVHMAVWMHTSSSQ